MARGTALVSTVARVVQLTGAQHLDNLETGGDLTLTDLLVTASDTIYDRLDGDGIDPTLLTNQAVYERAVAWEFLSSLFALGFATNNPSEDYERAHSQVERHYTMARPKSSADDIGRRANEAVPIVANWEPDTVYDTRANRRDVYYTRRPSNRT